jgi:hypothetical protein
MTQRIWLDEAGQTRALVWPRGGAFAEDEGTAEGVHNGKQRGEAEKESVQRLVQDSRDNRPVITGLHSLPLIRLSGTPGAWPSTWLAGMGGRGQDAVRLASPIDRVPPIPAT